MPSVPVIHVTDPGDLDRMLCGRNYRLARIKNSMDDALLMLVTKKAIPSMFCRKCVREIESLRPLTEDLPTQRELIPPEHRSLQPRRLRKSWNDWKRRVNPERIYAAAWRRQNHRLSHINHGFTTIEWILCPDGKRWPPPVSRRDAAVAASVIQWLGTNAGAGFLRTVERAIDAAQKREFDTGRIDRMVDLIFGPNQGEHARGGLVKPPG